MKELFKACIRKVRINRMLVHEDFKKILEKIESQSDFGIKAQFVEMLPSLGLKPIKSPTAEEYGDLEVLQARFYFY